MQQIDIRLPDGSVQPLTYPDDWTDEQLQTAIHQQFDDYSKPNENVGVEQMQSEIPSAPEFQEDYMQPLRESIESFGDIEKGGRAGLTQGLANALASIGNLPSDLMKATTGKEPYRIPKTDLSQYAPDSEVGQSTFQGADLAGEFAAPGGALMKGARGLMDSSKIMQMLPNVLKNITSGAVAGGALSEGDRATGAEIGAGVSAIPGAYQATKSFLTNTPTKALNKGLKDLQSFVNKKTDDVGNVLNNIEGAVKNKGISKVKIDNDIIENAQTYLSKTKANKDLLEKARTGDFEALRKLQADLRTKGEKRLAADTQAENDLGEVMLETRGMINESIENHLLNNGAEDLAKSLNEARNIYREIQETYFSSPALARVFGKSQKVPRNIKTFLQEDSTEMNRLKEAHPEIEKALSKALKETQRKKSLKTVGKIAGTGLTAGAAMMGAEKGIKNLK